MSIADAMATNGMKEMGYEYINFDGKVMLTATIKHNYYTRGRGLILVHVYLFDVIKFQIAGLIPETLPVMSYQTKHDSPSEYNIIWHLWYRATNET